MSEKTCGDNGGRNVHGEPCSLPAGHGLPSTDEGPCYHHRELVEEFGDLLVRERVFVEEYVGPSWYNATKAARRAGYAESSAHSIGYRLLRKAKIKAAIERVLDDRSASRAEITARMSARAQGTLDPFIQVINGRAYVNLANPVVQEHMHLLKKIKQKTVEVTYDAEDGVRREVILTEVELHDAQRAEEALAKIRGMYRENETTVNVNVRQMSDRELLDRLEERRNRLEMIKAGKLPENGEGP